MKQQSGLVISIVMMALGLTGGLLQHCSRFLERLPHCSLQISKMVEAFSYVVPAVPNLLELAAAAAESLVASAAGNKPESGRHRFV